MMIETLGRTQLSRIIKQSHSNGFEPLPPHMTSAAFVYFDGGVTAT